MVSFELLFPISILAGFVGAIGGMGGGVILIPALTLLGVDIKHAIAISILSVIATSSGSASAYVRDHLTNLKVGMFLEMFTIVGALAGARITIASSSAPLYIIFGLVLLGSWIALFAAGHYSWHEPQTQDAFSRWLELEGSYPDQVLGKTVHYKARRAYFGAPLMFGAGVIAGLLGIGAGAVKVLIHDLVMGLPPKVSTTTSNLIIGVTALAGTSVYLYAGLIEPGLAAPVILGVVIGAFLGTRLLVRLSNQAVRRVFLFILLILAAEMIFRGLRGV
ncbi:MAG TPA: sulfite exporter TauE/SafE family protein [Candidatus Acidoferrum sp.]|nr:sulfite exporter TauE/SafE family protein [Candidatus Acidoferrum sp.]